jgi:hypothetical protein
MGYTGPLSIEWEDAGMAREFGAPASLDFIRKLDWDLPKASFDAAFASAN